MQIAWWAESAADDVLHPETGEVLVAAGQEITEELAKVIEETRKAAKVINQ